MWELKEKTENKSVFQEKKHPPESGEVKEVCWVNYPEKQILKEACSTLADSRSSQDLVIQLQLSSWAQAMESDLARAMF